MYGVKTQSLFYGSPAFYPYNGLNMYFGGLKCLQKFGGEISWKTSTWKKKEEIGGHYTSI
jgi:hypothetical protein